VAAQDPRHRARRHPDLRAEHVLALAVLSPRSQDLLLGHGTGPGGRRVRPRRTGFQTGLALGGVAVDPGAHTLARDAHRRSDVGLLPAGSMAPNGQQPAMHGQTGITVGHESLQGGVGP
jgi:hypothetical protein